MTYPYMQLNDGTEIAYSDVQPDGKVLVYIEKPDEKDGLKEMVCLVPTGEFVKNHGFTYDEIGLYLSFAKKHALNIMDLAREQKKYKVMKEGDWFVAKDTDTGIATQGGDYAEAVSNLNEALELFNQDDTREMFEKFCGKPFDTITLADVDFAKDSLDSLAEEEGSLQDDILQAEQRLSSIRNRRIELQREKLRAAVGMCLKIIDGIARIYDVPQIEFHKIGDSINPYQLPALVVSDECSRFQIGILNGGRGSNIKYLPYVYTEQGVAMLTSALHTDRAIEASIQIMEAFVEMSHYIRQNQQLLPYDELKALELKHYQLSDKVQNIEDNMLTRADLSDLMKLFDSGIKSEEILILNGEPFKADEAFQRI